MSDFRRGLQVFARDMRQEVPLAWTVAITLIAFALVFIVLSGSHS